MDHYTSIKKSLKIKNNIKDDVSKLSVNNFKAQFNHENQSDIYFKICKRGKLLSKNVVRDGKIDRKNNKIYQLKNECKKYWKLQNFNVEKI